MLRICMCIITLKEERRKQVMNLKQRKEGYMKGLEGEEERNISFNYIMFKNKRKNCNKILNWKVKICIYTIFYMIYINNVITLQRL